MEDYVLGYDCDENIIEEYMILRAIWSNDIDIEELEDSDPRMYCAVVGYDGNGYAISVHDSWHSDLIRKRENIPSNEKIPIIVKPIKEMVNYEIAYTWTPNGYNFFVYDFDCNELKETLNKILKQEQNKRILK